MGGMVGTGDSVRSARLSGVLPERDVDQADHHGHLDQRPDHRGEGRAAADAEVAMVTAMASSKLFDAAVNDSVVACP
jgi:hypothetical protein